MSARANMRFQPEGQRHATEGVETRRGTMVGKHDLKSCGVGHVVFKARDAGPSLADGDAPSHVTVQNDPSRGHDQRLAHHSETARHVLHRDGRDRATQLQIGRMRSEGRGRAIDQAFVRQGSLESCIVGVDGSVGIQLWSPLSSDRAGGTYPAVSNRRISSDGMRIARPSRTCPIRRWAIQARMVARDRLSSAAACSTVLGWSWPRIVTVHLL